MERSGPEAAEDHWQQGSRFVALADQKTHLEESGGDGVHLVFQASEIIIDAVEHSCFFLRVSKLYFQINQRSDHELTIEFEWKMPCLVHLDTFYHFQFFQNKFIEETITSEIYVCYSVNIMHSSTVLQYILLLVVNCIPGSCTVVVIIVGQNLHTVRVKYL